MKDSDEKVAIAIEVIIDNSGSMQRISKKVVKGVNEFIAELASAVFPARLGVTLFDDVLRTSLIDGVSVAEAPRIQDDDYNPCHGTEDIAHSVIQGLEKRLAPVNAHQKVLVVVTDGLNRSAEMARAQALVAKRQAEGWLIIWLGVYVKEMKAQYKPLLLEYAKGLGIPEGMTFALATEKIDKVMPLAAHSALRFLGTGDSKAAEFTAKERGLID